MGLVIAGYDVPFTPCGAVRRRGREPPEGVEVGAFESGTIESVSVGVTESWNLVEVEAGEKTAVYTADEARTLAEKVLEVSDEENDNSNVANYIFQLADVVDGKLEPEEIERGAEDYQ